MGVAKYVADEKDIVSPNTQNQFPTPETRRLLPFAIYAKRDFCLILLHEALVPFIAARCCEREKFMANAEQLEIIKQGADVWNRWRGKNPYGRIDLTEADLSGAHLSGAHLIDADLTRSDLSGADLSSAHLIRAHLGKSHLIEAVLTWAQLMEADLTRADLTGADLSRASLIRADLRGANLSKANLHVVDFFQVVVGATVFANLDLSKPKELMDVHHTAPSTIGTNSLAISNGKIPEKFLRGCGLSDWEIEQAKLYNPDLNNEAIIQIQYRIYELRATQALQISPLFISYSRADGDFVDKVGNSLKHWGIRYWRDIHDMKAGRLEKQIDRAIRQNPTVLLVLSEQSLRSDWVEHEVRTARDLEKEIGRDVLCPVALDDSWKESKWDKLLMGQVMKYNILDFSAWKDVVKFEGMFRKLIDGLELFYKR